MDKYPPEIIIPAATILIFFVALINHVAYRWQKGYWSFSMVVISLFTLSVFPYRYYRLIKKQRAFSRKIKEQQDIRKRINAVFIKDKNRNM